MRLRSLLFVPGDRPDRFDKAAGCGADAIILDLEDSVAPTRKAAAREAVGEYLSRPAALPRFVRINPVDSGMLEDDLAAVRRADGVVLPKALGAETVRFLADHWDVGVPILPIATETPRAIFNLGSYGKVSGRLCGLTWGAEDLSAAIAASGSRTSDGAFTPPFQMVRAMALFAAHAADVAAIETVYPAIRDMEGLAAYAARGAYDGFTGMLALHPDQVPVINAAFTPKSDQVEKARAIVAAFAAQPDAGVLSLDGQMVDQPHLKQARNILARAGEEPFGR